MFEDLKALRKRHGLTQYELAELTGLDRPNLSAIEAGRRAMSTKLATRVLKALDEDDSPSAADLVIGNRLRAFKRQKDAGDTGGMLDSITAVTKAAATTRPGAVDLVREMISEVEETIDEEDGFTEDDRDLYGRVRPAVKNAGDTGLDGDDRDVFGRRIAPLDDDLDNDQNEDEDDEDYLDSDERDLFGRRIGA